MGQRPAEIRNNLLNRWVRMKREERLLKSWEIPDDPGTVKTIAECEAWRKKILSDMNEVLNRLYTEPLPEAETKHLNDDINRTIQKVRRWEKRIVELGGLDYSRVGHSTPDGDVLNTNLNQYQYFGRARLLPGVKDYIEFEKQRRLDETQSSNRLNKPALMAKVDANYFGLETVDFETDELKAEKEWGASDFDPKPDLTIPPIPTPDAIEKAIEELRNNHPTILQ